MKHIQSAGIEHPGYLALHFHDGGVAHLGPDGGEYWNSEADREAGAQPDKSAEWGISKLSASACISEFGTEHTGGNVWMDYLRMLSRHFIAIGDNQILIFETDDIEQPPIGELEVYV